MKVKCQAVDLSAYSDLVEIYLGMKVNAAFGQDPFPVAEKDLYNDPKSPNGADGK